MQKIEETHHISEESWLLLEDGRACQEEFMQILEHTCKCTYCADRMAAVMSHERMSILPPSYLSDQIRERTKQMDVRTAAAIKHTSRELQLILYSLKVGAAVAVSLFLLAITSGLQQAGYVQEAGYGIGYESWGSIRQDGESRTAVPGVSSMEQENGEERETILEKLNGSANGVTDKMNDFANLILNGGKQE